MTDEPLTDEFAWLEDVLGDEALSWVRSMNARAEDDLFREPLFEELRTGILEVLEADDRIPMPSLRRGEVLNFWTDSSHRRGVLRRTTWDSYKTDDPDWEIVLDVDALGEAEGESWVFHGMSARRPDGRRALIDLSPGGSDASVTREFDLVEKRFIPPEEGGFVRPLAKGWLVWVDDDTVYAGNDFGPGSLTTSGYPRTIRRWHRGTELADAPTVFEGEESDVSVSVSVATLPGFRHQMFRRGLDFYTARRWMLRDGQLVAIDVPDDARLHEHERWLLIQLRSDWAIDERILPGGSLLGAELEAFLRGERELHVVFEPSESAALADYAWTRNHILLRIQEHVRDRLEIVSPTEGWLARNLVGAPPVWTVEAVGVDPDESDDVFLVGNDFVTPTTLTHVGPDGASVVKNAPARFDASGVSIAQHFVTSADGTEVPYFLVRRDNDPVPAPTLLGGYGGFEVSNTAVYSGIIGQSWLARGGTYVLANIRGGGEYGPRWHRAGLRENRHRVYEDFEAVARDLIDRGVTTPRQLGISGGSNGGLLVGNMYVRCPDLFGAVVCQVPLLDMKRYPHLLAGASWMAEYGDPDKPDDWEFIQTFSPYHLIEADRPYPPMLLTTSTRDDRVHPGHARKMAAALTKLGYDVTYWENIEGGHSAGADAPQQATMYALAFTFLHRHLMDAAGD